MRKFTTVFVLFYKSSILFQRLKLIMNECQTTTLFLIRPRFLPIYLSNIPFSDSHSVRLNYQHSLVFSDFSVCLSPYKTNFSSSCEKTSNCVDVWVICKRSRSSLRCIQQPNYASCISISAFQNARGIYYQFFFPRSDITEVFTTSLKYGFHKIRRIFRRLLLYEMWSTYKMLDYYRHFLKQNKDNIMLLFVWSSW